MQRLIRLKTKYMYDKIIKEILNINEISQIRFSYNYLYNNLKNIDIKEELDINQGFISRLKHKIYS